VPFAAHTGDHDCAIIPNAEEQAPFLELPQGLCSACLCRFFGSLRGLARSSFWLRQSVHRTGRPALACCPQKTWQRPQSHARPALCRHPASLHHKCLELPQTVPHHFLMRNRAFLLSRNVLIVDALQFGFGKSFVSPGRCGSLAIPSIYPFHAGDKTRRGTYATIPFSEGKLRQIVQPRCRYRMLSVKPSCLRVQVNNFA